MNLRHSYRAGIFLSIFMLTAQFMQAQVRLPRLVSDHMVLQRDVQLKIWGWASPAEKISVKFQNKTYSVTASTAGSWIVLLPAMKAGGPYTMDISSSNHITLRDILVGDVWFCAGQSNMVLPMERVKERYPEEIAGAVYPEIRNFFISTSSDVTRLHDDLPVGTWKVTNPVNVMGFGAASYFFAKKIYEQYHIPIGIINSSVGGTPIEAWISADGFKQFPAYTERLRQFKDTAYVHSMTRPAPVKKDNGKQPDKGLNGIQTWYDPAYIPDGWHSFWLPGYWADQGIRGLNGIVWFRKEINLPASAAAKPAKLFMGRIVDADMVYVNGVLAGSTTYQYPPRRYELPAGLLKPGKNIIVVKVVNDAGKGGFVPDKPYNITIDDQKIDLRGDWQYKVGQVFDPPKAPAANTFMVMQNEPAGLYNTMVAPAINFAIKGVLWYQGEANTFKPAAYGHLLPALIADWRAQWHQPELPFIYAQLPNFMEAQYSPAESQWAELRQQQLKTLSVPYTAMAVTIDAGEWNDIHPTNKKSVGERLALAAERLAYNNKTVIASGPLYQSAVIDGKKITLSFTGTGSGLIAKDGGELTQFAIAGADHKFVWATARIEGNKVIVWNDELAKPLYVRYAWADNPDGANLYNKEGLPASPFSTE